MTMMFQCEMTQDGLDQNYIGVAWIEERGAFVGALVEVPELGGWWRITAVYQPGRPKNELSATNATKRRGFNSIDRTK